MSNPKRFLNFSAASVAVVEGVAKRVPVVRRVL
jgi:hypothetical protein